MIYVTEDPHLLSITRWIIFWHKWKPTECRL